MDTTANIPLGATATKSLVVSRDLTVAHFDPQMPEVLGTPIMIFLMEVTASEAIEKYIPPGWISVGTMVNIKHLAATPLGLTVTARAKVISIDKNTVTFEVEAHDGTDKIGEGIHARTLIERNRLEKRMQSKKESSSGAQS